MKWLARALFVIFMAGCAYMLYFGWLMASVFKRLG